MTIQEAHDRYVQARVTRNLVKKLRGHFLSTLVDDKHVVLVEERIRHTKESWWLKMHEADWNPGTFAKMAEEAEKEIETKTEIVSPYVRIMVNLLDCSEAPIGGPKK